MTRTMCSLAGAIAAGVLLATAVAAVAETCTLTLKRRETKSPVFDRASYAYWSVRPQYFYVQMNATGNGPLRTMPNDQSQTDAFKRIVKKEPKYQSEYPFRGVVKLGSQEYAFALDVASPPDAKAKKSDAKTKSPDAKGTAVKDTAEPAATTDVSATTGKPRAKLPPIKDFAYNRLYFDFNRNGDLTDDKVVEAPANSPGFPQVVAMSYARFEFPRVDVTIDVEGTKLDYSFHLEGYANGSSDYCNVMVQVSAAVCREGDITLEGKKHHIVLLDNNSNGRFDDEGKINENVHMASGQVYPEPGDMLLIDPEVGATPYDSPYDPTSSDYRNYVSKMIQVDGRWYNLKISPAGDKLTLTPSTVPLGSVTNRNEAFRALIYSDGKGFLKIRGNKGAPIPVPEGQWTLLTYTITRAEPAKPAVKPATEKPAETKTAETKTAETKPADKAAKAKQGSLLAAFGQLAGALGGGVTTPLSGPSFVCATATDKYKPVTVTKGETVELPFGPPYTPTVTAMSYGNPGQAQPTYLEMSLVGVSGEVCTNMIVKGGRPGKPEFTITDPKGKVVQEGNFEYG